MTWVVDASVALKWSLPEEDSDLARELLRKTLIAPDWWLVEAGNGLWKSVGRREISAAEAVVLLADLNDVPVTSVDARTILGPAVMLGCELNHPVYDCLYLALAVERDIGLVTADSRFIRALSNHPDLARRVVSLASGDWR